MESKLNRLEIITQFCNECKIILKAYENRFYCCNRTKCVCNKCNKNICKLCMKKRDNKIQFVQCSNRSCKRVCQLDDVFYDFKGNYHICSKCLGKDFRFYYQKSLNQNKDLGDVQLQTNMIYPYRDLINYFKNWCFCCATKLNKENAFQLIRQARVCSDCLTANIQLLEKIIRCISCEGFIHSPEEIYQHFGNQKEVLCKYCADQQKAHIEATNSLKQISAPKISVLKTSKVVVSALQLSKKQSSFEQVVQQKQKSKLLKIVSMNSIEYEVQNLPLKIRKSECRQSCQICRSIIGGGHLFSIKSTDKNIEKSLLKLFGNRQELRLCPLCFGEQIQDKNETIQFNSLPTRQIEIEESIKQPKIALPKLSLAEQGASQNIFQDKKK